MPDGESRAVNAGTAMHQPGRRQVGQRGEQLSQGRLVGCFIPRVVQWKPKHGEPGELVGLVQRDSQVGIVGFDLGIREEADDRPDSQPLSPFDPSLHVIRGDVFCWVPWSAGTGQDSRNGPLDLRWMAWRRHEPAMPEIPAPVTERICPQFLSSPRRAGVLIKCPQTNVLTIPPDQPVPVAGGPPSTGPATLGKTPGAGRTAHAEGTHPTGGVVDGAAVPLAGGLGGRGGGLA